MSDKEIDKNDDVNEENMEPVIIYYPDKKMIALTWVVFIVLIFIELNTLADATFISILIFGAFVMTYRLCSEVVRIFPESSKVLTTRFRKRVVIENKDIHYVDLKNEKKPIIHIKKGDEDLVYKLLLVDLTKEDREAVIKFYENALKKNIEAEQSLNLKS